MAVIESTVQLGRLSKRVASILSLLPRWYGVRVGPPARHTL